MTSSSAPGLTALAERFIAKLTPSPELRERLRDSLATRSAAVPAVLWTAPRPAELPWPVLPPAPWQPAFVDRLPEDATPGRHPLHGAGSYYCLDLSSVFEGCATLPSAAHGSAPRTVIDMCAAPGGKSIFASTAFRPELLIANEVIAKRHAPLAANFNRCAVPHAAITRADPQQIAIAAPGAADLVIVDAPCSGQSLWARGEDAHGCFHPVLISKNARRQRRILAESRAAVAPGGYLAYMTCTYAREENEENIEWLVKGFPELEIVPVEPLEAHRSPLTDLACYRLWPFEGYGAGGFCALLRRVGAGSRNSVDLSTLRPRWVSRGNGDEKPADG